MGIMSVLQSDPLGPAHASASPKWLPARGRVREGGRMAVNAPLGPARLARCGAGRLQKPKMTGGRGVAAAEAICTYYYRSIRN